ncbi:MAG: hypothetical protein AB8B69_05730 [Chitinophagales bacterium]
MKKVQSFICVIALIISLSSCEKEAVSPLQTLDLNPISTSSTDLFVPDGEAIMVVEKTGTVMRQDGKYIIRCEKATYLPTGLPAEYSGHKLRVFFAGEVQTDALNEEIIPIELTKITGTDRTVPQVSTTATALDIRVE